MITHKLVVYKKPIVESATLSFSVISFFQHFDLTIIDTLNNMNLIRVKKFLKTNRTFSQKICCISHVNVEIMKILELAKKPFSVARFFCKRLIYITLICNHKVEISPFLRNCK